MIHEVVRDYQVVAKLGEGGMGEVWLARHRHLGHEVAIKVLAPFLRDRPDFAQRLLMEARNQVRLSHPHIVAVMDFFEEAGDFYMVTEYCRGHNLHQLLTAKGILPVRTALALVKPALSALNHAHSQGVIHRDIKPANLMVGENGEVKVMDFGLALTAGMQRAGGHAPIIGSPHYMSPEQIRDPACSDHRIDVYAMGVVLYEMLTARVPFDGATAEAIWEGHLKRIPTAPRMINPKISKTLNQIILKAMNKDPEKRFAGCGEFLSFIEYLEQEEGLADASRPTPAAAPAAKHAYVMSPPREQAAVPPTSAAAPAVPPVRVHPLSAAPGTEVPAPGRTPAGPAPREARSVRRPDAPKPSEEEEEGALQAVTALLGGLPRPAFTFVAWAISVVMPLVVEVVLPRGMGMPLLPGRVGALFFGGAVSLSGVTLSLWVYTLCLCLFEIGRAMAHGRLTKEDLPVVTLESLGLSVAVAWLVLHLAVPLLCFAASWWGLVTMYRDGSGEVSCDPLVFWLAFALWYGVLLLPLIGARIVTRLRA